MIRVEVTADGEVFEVELTPAEVAAIEAERALEAPAIAAREVALANEVTLRDRADVAIANLEAAHAGWSGLTAAQKDAALKLTVRVVVALSRLVLRRLDQA